MYTTVASTTNIFGIGSDTQCMYGVDSDVHVGACGVDSNPLYLRHEILLLCFDSAAAMLLYGCATYIIGKVEVLRNKGPDVLECRSLLRVLSAHVLLSKIPIHMRVWSNVR